MLLTDFLVGCVAAPAQLRSLHPGWELLLWARSMVQVAWQACNLHIIIQFVPSAINTESWITYHLLVYYSQLWES